MKRILNCLLIALGASATYSGVALANTGIDPTTAIASSMVEATRDAYQAMVVQKLTLDGTGASETPDSQKGYVPTADAFMRRWAFEAIVASKGKADKLYTMTYNPSSDGLIKTELLDPSLPDEKKALVIAKILDGMMYALRATYTKMVVQKLKADGAGASLEYESKPGFAPLPAVFARVVGKQAVASASEASQKQIDFALRSQWNLNNQQGLQDEFEKTGWKFLTKQQDTQIKEDHTLKSLAWKPFVKLDSVGGKSSLRYFSADIASGKSCVSCHNNWEQSEDIKTIRHGQGINEDKVFDKYELMGAFSIAVEMN